MRSHIEQLARVFRDHYAPADWKAASRNWDVERERSIALNAIEQKSPITPKDFHKIIARFAQAAGDYHVGARFYSTEQARLPFSVMAVQGRFFVVDVDRTYHPDFPLEPGDEIVSFDGKPIGEEIGTLRAELGDNVAATDTSLAALRLTARSGRVGMDVPQGPVTIGVKKSDGGPTVQHQLKWDYEPERLAKGQPAAARFGLPGEARTSFSTEESPWARFGTMHTHHVAHPGQTDGSLNRFAIGARESFIPKLGEVVWESSPSSPFHAYIFKMSDGKKVGYVRIPHYNAAQAEVLQFIPIMARMQFQTDGLIIDQINNPGGSVGYLYSLAAMLTDELLYTPRHRMNITQREVDNAYNVLEINDSEFEAQGIPESLRNTLRDNARFIVQQWREGKTRTDPYHLGLGDYIEPSPLIRYSKPLMVITNELDFSGGDFFPAILQDNERAKIFGTRTAGAGGYVGLIDQTPNDLGLWGVTYTGSLAERID
ncbi:MAG: protease-like activity factor CPAF, partial [Myxococcota bacterium]